MLELAMLPLLASGDDEEVAIAFFLCATVLGTIGIITSSWRKHREAAYNARLKQMMIERGMSAPEIDVVIRSKASGKTKADRCNHV